MPHAPSLVEVSRPASEAPGPSGRALVSLLFDWQRNGLAALESLAQQYGDVVCVRLPGVRAYLLNGPDRIKHALIDNSDNYLKTPGSTHARMYFGDSMQLNNGEKARRLRQWITPIFHHSRVAQDMNSFILRAIDESLSQWQPGARPTLTNDLLEMALSVGVQTHFGTNPGEDTRHLASLFQQALLGLNQVSLPAWLPTPANNRYSQAIRKLDEAVLDRIRQRRATGPTGTDLLSSFVDPQGASQQSMSDAEIRHELASMMAAASQTIGIAINQTLRLVAQHPRVGETLFDEVSSLSGAGSAYTEQVVKESLRIAPPAGMLARVAAADDQVGPWRIRAGSKVFVSAWVMHRDSRYFADPLSFRPERWTPDFERKLPLCSYLPFGRGARSCVAGALSTLILKCMLASIIQRFRLEPSTPPASTDFKPFDRGNVPLTLHARR